jgi:hypothetical protein
MEKDWGFLLINTSNALNEQNQTGMLWTVWHEWPSGAWLTYNCYKHWETLVIRYNNGSGIFLFSKEGITQGDPPSMFAYGVGILLLIHRLKLEFLAVEQPWYADDAGADGKLDAIWYLFLRLKEIGPSYGNFPEP